jgi:hypothetical protein
MNELLHAFYMTIELWAFMGILLVAMIVKGEF